MFKITKNAIFGLEKNPDFLTKIILFFTFQGIVQGHQGHQGQHQVNPLAFNDSHSTQMNDLNTTTQSDMAEADQLQIPDR